MPLALRFRSALVAMALAVQAWPAVASQGRPDPAIARFETRLAEDIRADGIASIAAAVIIDTTVVWQNAFGLADRERGVAADARTIYRIGSISKSVTAVVLLRLVQQGVVALDDPVIEHLPEFAGLGGGVPESGTITLRQLASHTSGLVREPALPDAAAGPIAGWEQKILDAIPATTLRGAPAAAYAYSNIGYGILGLALARAAGEPFTNLVQHLFFEPLRMTSSTFVVRPPLDARLAAGYASDRGGNLDGALPALEHAGRGYKVPNGGIYSTVGDLARFIALMSGGLGDDVLSAASRTEMMRAQTPGDPAQAYGLGFFLRRTETGRRVVYHSGSVAGYTAMMLFDPDRRLGVVLLRNYAGGRTDLLAAARQLLEELATGRGSGP